MDNGNNTEKKPRIIPLGQITGERKPWWIEEILPEKSLVFISGLPKAGKSILSLYMALCLAEGKPFLGKYSISKKAKIIYYCFEDDHRDVRQRAKYFLGGRPFPDDHLFIAIEDYWLNLPVDIGKVEEDIKEHKKLCNAKFRPHGEQYDLCSGEDAQALSRDSGPGTYRDQAPKVKKPLLLWIRSFRAQ